MGRSEERGRLERNSRITDSTSVGSAWRQLLRAGNVRPNPGLEPTLPPPVQEGRHSFCGEHHVQWGTRYVSFIYEILLLRTLCIDARYLSFIYVRHSIC